MKGSQATITHSKPKPPKGLTLYFPRDLRGKVTKLSKADRRSLSQMVCILLEEALAARNGNGKHSLASPKG